MMSGPTEVLNEGSSVPEAPEQATVVWIRSTVECGLDMSEEYLSVPTAEWDAMTEAQRDTYLVDTAIDHQNNYAPCGATVVEPEDVPGEWKS